MGTFNDIKSTLKDGSGKCVVIENNAPEYMVMTWREYEKLVSLIEKLKSGADIDINDIPL